MFCKVKNSAIVRWSIILSYNNNTLSELQEF